MKRHRLRGFLFVVATGTLFVGGFVGFICYDMDPGLPVWPVWGGNLHNTHYAANERIIGVDTVKNLAPRWTTRVTGNVTAIPTVSETRVYFPDWGLPFVENGNLYALNRDTGAVLFKKPMSCYTKSITNTVSRSSPALWRDLLVIGDVKNLISAGLGVVPGKGATVYAINRVTGALVWQTTFEKHPGAVVTQSPVVYNGRVYVGASSVEEASSKLLYKCCSFRGCFACLDISNGNIIWKRFMIPPADPAYKGFTGAGVWGSSPAIDEERGVVYIATGNNYTVSRELSDCLNAATGDAEAQQQCFDEYDLPENYTNTVLALDLIDGDIRWVRKMKNYGAWTYACDPSLVPWLVVNPANCRDLQGLDYDFGQAPMLFTTTINGVERDVVGVGQKDGIFWLLDPDNDGATIWATSVGPGGTLGGMEFGSATDGERIYVQITNSEHVPIQLVAGEQAGKTVNGGVWAALDAATGTILWQTPDPSSFRPLKGHIVHPFWGGGHGPGFFALANGPMTVANGVVFAGSMDLEGHMYAFSAATGEILWSFASGGSVLSAPSVADGVVYWGSGYRQGSNSNRFFAFEVQ